MDAPLKVGLVGAGVISQSYAQAFDGLECGQLVAVADVRPEAARALAEGLGAKSFESHKTMLAESALDALIVCTPPATHARICIEALEQGAHVLCEKPLTIDRSSAVTMLETADSAGKILTMASKFRYVDDVIRAKSIVTSGLLGEITLFENAFTARVDMSSRWNSDPRVSGGGVLIDNGTHSVDLMRYFLGPLTELQVWEGKRSQSLPVEETVRVFARSEGGVLGSIDLSWTINKDLERYLNIYGSQGTVAVGWKGSRYRAATNHDWVSFGQGYDKVQAFRSQIRNFCGAIRGEEKLLITAEDALGSVEVIETAYEALRRNRWVPVNHAETGAARLA